MLLIQIFLPLYDNEKKILPKNLFIDLEKKIIKKFSGLTVYQHAPVKGIWDEGKGHSVDSMIIFEIMCTEEELDWWKKLKPELEEQFRQKEILIRIINCDKL